MIQLWKCTKKLDLTQNQVAQGSYRACPKAVQHDVGVRDRYLFGIRSLERRGPGESRKTREGVGCGRQLETISDQNGRDSGDASGKGWARALRADKGIKFKLIAVAHRDEPVTKGQVAIYFYPMGSSEKAVIEVTDGSETFSTLIFGLTGRVELRDGELKNLDDHMLKNVMGDKDAKREDSQ